MKKIVEILMRRDGYSENEAWNIVESCKEEMDAAILLGDYNLCVDIIECDLGLEPDYLEYFLM